MALMAGFVLGCAVQLQQATLFSDGFYMAFCLVALCLIAGAAIKYRAIGRQHIALNTSISRSTARAGWRMLAAALLAGSLGFGITGLRAVAFQADALQPSLEGPDVQVVGLVAAMPQRSEAGLRFRLAVESAQSAGRPVTLPPHIYLSWYSALLRTEDPSVVPFAELQQGLGDLRAGERWALTVRLKAPHGNANPHGFDYELWLWEQGLQATGYVRATPKDAANGGAPRKLGSTWQHPVERARQQVRDAIFARLAEPGPMGLLLEPRLAGVIAALVVGDQAAIERADWDIYRATGVAHLMSISGLHVTMFAWAAGLCVGWLWRRSNRAMLWLPAQHAALVGGVLLAACYALFSGWGVPSQRTIWMLAAVALLRLSGKQWPWPLVWLLAMGVVVAMDPWALLQAGFWLSFVAVGVLFATDGRGVHAVEPSGELAFTQSPHPVRPEPVEGLVPTRRPRWSRLRAHPAAQKLVAAAREQWTITLALTPLSLLLFQQVSVVGLLANALAIPWVTLVVTPLAMLGVLLSPAWTAAALCVQALGVVLAWFASWPLATISVAAPAIFLGATAVIGAIVLAMRLPWALRAMGAAMVLPVLLWQPPRPASGQFELLAADIGQGNAVLVRTATRSLLYDTGPRFSRESDAGQRTLVPLLRALGEKLDTVVLSHRDSDHTGGAAAILAMQPQAALLSSLEDGHELLGLRPSPQRCMAGQAWRWDGVDFAVLHPQTADYEVQNKSNAMSCVLRISNGPHTALLVGDIEAAQEARLVQTYATAAGSSMPAPTQTGTVTSVVQTENTLQADLLLMPHHGSKTSSTPEFLDAVQPRIALGQAGYRNRFNHPAPEVAQRYTERNIPLITSPRCGAATWRSAQPQELVCQREKTKRYWHHQVP
jgi:competence protein ComEC